MNEDVAADIRAWVALTQTHQEVLGRVESALKGAGLPPLPWHDVLLELDRAGDAGLRPFELEERLLLPQYGLSRLLARIEKAGLTARRSCAGDRRGFAVIPTEDGRRMLHRMWPIHRAALLAAIGMKLSKDEVATLAGLLGRLGSNDFRSGPRPAASRRRTGGRNPIPA